MSQHLVSVQSDVLLLMEVHQTEMEVYPGRDHVAALAAHAAELRKLQVNVAVDAWFEEQVIGTVRVRMSVSQMPNASSRRPPRRAGVAKLM